ncbi:hypothetical protein DEIPH_ctg023orf0042 [Deinococcus phoenicis]|uniref:Uncharacterized protein n=1 Tax=Deinococcus phoenicis TaxID=1476583 RepID=A0A016QRC9_9DEIO|nr:hypothetical protein [Deinococcus phoenicis]EYB68452.1 hypothetical protein DEIPH_ctg023orf0042 [Deinococcus phoenicis]
MPVSIRIYGQEATFSQGHWACDDDSLQAMLEALADPRAISEEAEQEHARYAAGRFGGLIATPGGWEAAPHPDAEIHMTDFAPARQPERAGWLSFLRRRK